METKTSKSQEEIWEAKELLYEEIKDFPNEKKMIFLHEKAQIIIEKYFKGKTYPIQGVVDSE